jgi:DNA end-binding protein Ku
MAARPMWTGTISFGLVTVPVALYSATEDHTISFHQLQRDTGDRVRNRRVNERTGDEVPYSEVVKGYPIGDGQHVPVEPEELAEIAPGRSRSIDIENFVDLADIDPVYFDKAYWLAPTGESTHAYFLLMKALAESDKVGIAKFVLRGKQHLTAVRAADRVLTLETLFFADEIRDPAKEIEDLPRRRPAKRAELDMAVNLIESMSGRWRPGDYRDTYRDKVAGLIKDKEQGLDIEPAEEPAEPTTVLDLTDALRRSIERGRSRSTAKRTAARRSSGRESAGSGTTGSGRQSSGTDKESSGRESAGAGKQGPGRQSSGSGKAGTGRRSSGSGKAGTGKHSSGSGKEGTGRQSSGSGKAGTGKESSGKRRKAS